MSWKLAVSTNKLFLSIYNRIVECKSLDFNVLRIKNLSRKQTVQLFVRDTVLYFTKCICTNIDDAKNTHFTAYNFELGPPLYPPPLAKI